MPTSPQALRTHVYDVLLERGLPPSCEAMGAHFGESADAIRSALGGLKIGKTIQMRPDGSEIWMAGPFASMPTEFRVTGQRAAWWANCAWDAFGVAVISGETGNVSTHCPDCDEALEFRADPWKSPKDTMVMHFLVQARNWYDDLGFT